MEVMYSEERRRGRSGWEEAESETGSLRRSSERRRFNGRVRSFPSNSSEK